MDGRGHASLVTHGLAVVVLPGILAAGLPPDAGRDVNPAKLRVLAVRGALLGAVVFLTRDRGSEG